MKLSKGKTPLYHQLEKILRKQILSGQLAPGKLFPTDHQLCEEFGVSRITVRQALKSLEDDGLIKREQGRGTFVSEQPGNRSFYEMSGSLEKIMGMRETYKIELTSKLKIQADRDIAAELGVEAGAEIWILEGRQELKEDLEQAQFLQVFASHEIGERIPLGEMEGRGFFIFLEKAAMETAVQFNQVLYATGADEKTSKIIHVPVGSPLLVNRNIFLSKKGRVLGVVVRYSPGDVHRIIHKMKMQKARL
ncbi:MAG: GntR family transcriptional regulator [Proteobacteria bacterium]|nr:GntR family transcriptional regulator [Pseudomonadota bacterium]